LRLLPTIILLCPIVPAVALAEPMHYERPVSAAPQEQDIGGGYAAPAVQRPLPRAEWWGAMDAGVLLAGLVLAAYLILKRRSRGGLVVLIVAAVIYFGFYRKGCICPIGAIQNVSAGLVDPQYVVPVIAVVFFALPLVFAILFGRVFCGGVCPLGAVQDLVALKPVQVPRRLDRVLGSFKYLYLGAAVWFAVQPAADRDFIICRYDPFVGFFRFNGPGYLLMIGGLLLLVGIFIGRPYCRYLCPYGAVLSVFSRFSWKNVSISPDRELDCGLCSGSCPFGAIEGMRARRSACLSCGRCYAACPSGKRK